MRAHAPGSVTGMFAPPLPGAVETRSRGVSFATEDGVTATVDPADRVTVRLDGELCSFEPVERVLADLGADAAVDLEAAVPIGAGFGASGAATLATAVAANVAFDLDRSRDELVEAAHRAEVASGTGLGDVFVQAAGGLVWRVGGGELRVTTPDNDSIEYASYGSISTSEVLADEAMLDRIRAVGDRTLARLPTHPTMREFTALSWTFALETGLVTEQVRATVERVRAAGGEASMAMLGETVFAVDVEGCLPNATRISRDGARLLD